MNQTSFTFEGSLLDRFHKFHAENPHVYQTLVTMCRQYKANEHKDKLGARMLIEAVRWDYRMKTKRDEDQPKINNDYSALYARMIMDRNPDLRGIFNIREMKQA